MQKVYIKYVLQEEKLVGGLISQVAFVYFNLFHVNRGNEKDFSRLLLQHLALQNSQLVDVM